jgi:hypothetical protein
MMGANDVLNLRTALLITLSILLVLVLWRRLRLNVLAKDMPAPQHAELLLLELGYHPARLIVQIKVPGQQTLGTALLDQQHNVMHTWGANTFEQGTHTLEQQLPPLNDGSYFLEMTSSTQRTVRQFRLQQA